MNVTFRKSFLRDLKKVKDQEMLARVRTVIEQVEAAKGIQDIADLKKLSGADDCYRIRLGEHRIGVVIANDTVDFVRCLPRRDLYRFFP
jgi:mRNA interferase RelE/StbE